MDTSQRRQARQQLSKPLWDEFEVWLKLQRTQVLDGTRIAEAIDYSLKAWKALTLHLDDGAVAMNNNLIERQIKPWKVSLADEIFVQQPDLLASILVLPRMGVGLVELEVPLHLLFVTFQAMKHSGHVWPIVTEDVQDRCMQRLTARPLRRRVAGRTGRPGRPAVLRRARRTLPARLRLRIPRRARPAARAH